MFSADTKDQSTNLPACGLLVAIVRIAVHDVRVYAVQIELAVRGIENGLRYHLRVAKLGFDVVVVVVTEVHAVSSHHDGRSADRRRLDAGGGSTALRGGRRSRALVVRRSGCDQGLPP